MAGAEPWSRALCPKCGRLGDRSKAIFAQDEMVARVTHRHGDHVWVVSWVVDEEPQEALGSNT